MKPFSEEMRCDYPDLTPDSGVIDIGGFEGNWSQQIYDKYKCNIDIYEPCSQFFHAIHERFSGNNKVFVHRIAVGGKNGNLEIGIKGDSTGEFAEGRKETVPLIDVAELIHGKIELFKINAEGAEFCIMERIIERDLADRIKHFQIQFHAVVPNYQARYDAICEGLARTHNRTFFAPFCWEGWTLK